MALGTGPVNNLTALSLVSPKLHTGKKKSLTDVSPLSYNSGKKPVSSELNGITCLGTEDTALVGPSLSPVSR